MVMMPYKTEDGRTARTFATGQQRTRSVPQIARCLR